MSKYGEVTTKAEALKVYKQIVQAHFRKEAANPEQRNSDKPKPPPPMLKKIAAGYKISDDEMKHARQSALNELSEDKEQSAESKDVYGRWYGNLYAPEAPKMDFSNKEAARVPEAPLLLKSEPPSHPPARRHSASMSAPEPAPHLDFDKFPAPAIVPQEPATPRPEAAPPSMPQPKPPETPPPVAAPPVEPPPPDMNQVMEGLDLERAAMVPPPSKQPLDLPESSPVLDFNKFPVPTMIKKGFFGRFVDWCKSKFERSESSEATSHAATSTIPPAPDAVAESSAPSVTEALRSTLGNESQKTGATSGVVPMSADMQKKQQKADKKSNSRS